MISCLGRLGFRGDEVEHTLCDYLQECIKGGCSFLPQDSSLLA